MGLLKEKLPSSPFSSFKMLDQATALPIVDSIISVVI